MGKYYIIMSTLYQYRSAAAFLSIIKSSSLRLVSHKHFHDPLEAEYAFGVYMKKLQGLEIAESDKNDSEFFITCFSKDGDSLPLWKSYTDECTGFAIGFDLTAPFSKEKNYRFKLDEVKYLKETEIEEELKELCEKVRAESKYEGGGFVIRGRQRAY